jgi:hypothetical protein
VRLRVESGEGSKDSGEGTLMRGTLLLGLVKIEEGRMWQDGQAGRRAFLAEEVECGELESGLQVVGAGSGDGNVGAQTFSQVYGRRDTVTRRNGMGRDGMGTAGLGLAAYSCCGGGENSRGLVERLGKAYSTLSTQQNQICREELIAI